MRGLICYYSGSGNTELVCRYLAKKVTAVEWTFCNVHKDKLPDPAAFGVLGFATFTDFWGMPERMRQFIQALPKQQAKPAFTLTTFGMAVLFSLRDLSRCVSRQGFKIAAGLSLHTPENFPPLICGNMTMEDSPSPGELRVFDRKLAELNQRLEQIKAGQPFKGVKPGEAFLLSWMPARNRLAGRKDMGEKFVDEALCTKCRTCEKGCPYAAIQLDPFPKFDMTRCYGCWACFHHCPQKAVYTAKFRGRGHYPKPGKKLLEKLAS